MLELTFKSHRNLYKFTMCSSPYILPHHTQNTPVVYPSMFHRLDDRDFISVSWPCSLLSFLHNCGFLPTCFYFSTLLKILLYYAELIWSLELLANGTKPSMAWNKIATLWLNGLPDFFPSDFNFTTKEQRCPKRRSSPTPSLCRRLSNGKCCLCSQARDATVRPIFTTLNT